MGTPVLEGLEVLLEEEVLEEVEVGGFFGGGKGGMALSREDEVIRRAKLLLCSKECGFINASGGVVVEEDAVTVDSLLELEPEECCCLTLIGVAWWI